MNDKDIIIEQGGDFKEKAKLGVQSVGLAILTWLGTNISEMRADIKELNVTMATIVTVSNNNKEQINNLTRRLDEKEKNDQDLRIRMWDQLNELRNIIKNK